MQLDYNTARQGLREHRRAARPKTVVTAGALDAEDIEKLESHPSNAILELNGLQPGQKVDDLLQAFTGPEINPALYDVTPYFEDTLRVVGFQEANMGGDQLRLGDPVADRRSFPHHDQGFERRRPRRPPDPSGEVWRPAPVLERRRRDGQAHRRAWRGLAGSHPAADRRRGLAGDRGRQLRQPEPGAADRQRAEDLSPGDADPEHRPRVPGARSPAPARRQARPHATRSSRRCPRSWP